MIGAKGKRKEGDGLVMEFVGKKEAGRLLDGKLWDEYPKQKG